MAVIVIVAILWIIYMVATKEQREEKREEKRREFEEKKQNMLSDPFILLMSESIVNSVTNLKDAAVKVLRTGGEFFLIFEQGSVYYETRWEEKAGDQYVTRRNTQCILDRIDIGKNPLNREENDIFKGIVYDKLKQVSWLDVIELSRELIVRKAKGIAIPEAF